MDFRIDLNILISGKHRRIILRPTRNPDADEATSATEERIINFLHRQCQSTDSSSLRENILKKYSFFVEQIEPIPVCIVILPRRMDRVSFMVIERCRYSEGILRHPGFFRPVRGWAKKRVNMSHFCLI